MQIFASECVEIARTQYPREIVKMNLWALTCKRILKRYLN